MKAKLLSLISILIFSCSNSISKNNAFVPESSGNLNHVTIVMPEKDWNGALGSTVRNNLEQVYEGLPIDEPQYTLIYMPPKAFTGFARQSRNILWFRNDTIAQFQLAQNQFARPQILAVVSGNDEEIQTFYFEENEKLVRQTFAENERKEKLRRITKSLSNETTLQTRFGYSLTYPTAYNTLKDTTNFVWIQKPILKGHLNIIAYTLPEGALEGNLSQRIPEIRDSIGKVYVPGRLEGSYLITEKAFLPYYYKTELDGKTSYLTKGTWEVANDFMAGPFVNYMVKDTIRNQWMVIEGFAFAPSESKREYMFELNTIISTLKQEL